MSIKPWENRAACPRSAPGVDQWEIRGKNRRTHGNLHLFSGKALGLRGGDPDM